MFLAKLLLEAIEDGESFNILRDWFLIDGPISHPEYHVYRKRMESGIHKLSIKTVMDIIAKFGDKDDRHIIGKYMIALMKNKAKYRKKEREFLNRFLRKKERFYFYFLTHFGEKPQRFIERFCFYKNVFKETVRIWVEKKTRIKS